MMWRALTRFRVQRKDNQNLTRTASVRRHFSEQALDRLANTSNGSSTSPSNFKYTVDSFSELINTEEERNKVHLILLEIASLADDTGRAPSIIKMRDMRDMLVQSVYQRKKHLEYMFKREMSQKNRKAKQDIKRQQHESRPKKDPQDIPPGIYPFIRSSQIHRALYGRRLAEAALFGQKIVFDCSFSEHMTNREIRNCADQLQLSYAANKFHSEPFDLTFCNLPEGSLMDELVYSHFAPFNPAQQLIHKTSKSYLDLFPRENLVYLSPNSRTPLKHWDHEAIYILGTIVDLGAEKPLTLAKAKKEGIPTARLPVQETVWLKQGAQKALTLNTMIEILLEARSSNDWRQAFKKLPPRFVEQTGQSAGRLRSLERAQKMRHNFLSRR